MSDDLETLVRKSLDAVDRSRRIATITTTVVFVFFVLALGFLFAHARVGEDPGASKVLWVATAAHMAFVGLCSLLLAGHITRMTKGVLRAVELASRKKE